MAATNGLCSTTEVKTRLGISDSADDTVLDAVVTACSRVIEAECGRRFWKNSSAEARYYTAEFADVLFCPDDIVSVANLYTDEDGDRVYENTWATADYDLEPYNALFESPVPPFTRIRVTPSGTYGFPVGVAKGVKINGVFGWNAVPPQASEACMLLSEQLFKRKEAIYGITGGDVMGELQMFVRNHIRSDPHLRMLIDPLRRIGIGGI